MLAKLSQSVTKEEANNIFDHYLFEGRIDIETYEDLLSNLRNFDDSRELKMEMSMDEPFVIVIR